ncbi:LacI family transcriptional regulator [Polymorphobacter multimanifer]|uniref:LacI family transcriptional regulator n=1 Tax=Polymorphobacter multimanifer TaxID=1070431 RepID=A0A841L661_9SPHN|nr:LacI family DNA-binding transcriptional regulator [Polymorphobacter multimanifer]MBB6228094.1 LacI family transcriptional regulator [Polymorphobacter multimanifer]GGI86379.1 LacI family transcriptional regulator [Polymorphobacter multimanifer]
MRSTIREVSAAAGVSVTTVSRVLNNEPYVKPATRRRVEEAIARLDFRPSVAARALAGQRSFQIALLYDNPSPYYIYSIQTGARAHCIERGFRVVFQECDVTSADLARDIAGLLAETHLDGVILSPPVSDSAEVIAALQRSNLPFVRIAPGGSLDISPRVFIDDEAAAERITDHLVGLGHRRIGFIIGHPDHVASNQRLTGFRRALARHGIAEEAELIQQGLFDFTSGHAAGRRMLTMARRPSAIFASNDDMGAGVLTAAHELGLAVPGDIAIAGFDDTDLARLVWPPLTTIRQPTRELAHAAAKMLIDATDTGGQQLDFELVIRGSTVAQQRLKS